MTESKFTQSPSGNELVSKINGVIDDLGHKVDTASLAAVATTGDYNDLLNKPTIRNIGEIVQSPIPLTDARLHLLDGSLLAYGSYQAFIDYIADLYDSGDCTYIFDTEVNWQSAVTSYGVCGKFVYDSVNNTVRLPKITGFTEGTITQTELGDLTEAGLPNITGEAYIRRLSNQGDVIITNRSTGAFSGSAGTGSTVSASISTTSGSNFPTDTFQFDASDSSSIYGNSNTVQPQSIKVYYYIVIATSTKTDIEVDIDEIATDLNGKADVDLTNVNDTGYIKMACASMPSNTSEDLTLGASGTIYTAPADGYVVFQCKASDTATVAISLRAQISSSDSTATILQRAYSNGSSSAYPCIYLPVRRGQAFQATYTGNTTSHIFRFVYAQGSESEAS